MAATRDVFSKVVSNVKLATTFDADGKEIQVRGQQQQMNFGMINNRT